MTGRRRAIGLLLALAPLAAGCSSPPPPQLAIQVDQPTALIDTQLRLRLVGLSSGEAVTLAAQTVDRNGSAWSSSAQFKADGQGVVTLADMAPASGSYSRADAMGLFRSLKPTTGQALPFYLPPAPSARVTLTATAGSSTATTTVVRLLTRARVTVHDQRPDPDGFYGEYYEPESIGSNSPAVLVLGGEEGGLYFGSLVARLLASHGYPALAVAYFGAPGLPQTLNRIPLENFQKALTWLRQQPGVDAAHVLTYGVSRGSEAALLLAGHYPELVNGAIALAPNSKVADGAWTIGGRPLVEALPVTRIAGPLLMVCGGADLVAKSCDSGTAIQAQLDAARHPYPHTLLAYPQAGHGVGDLTPYIFAGRMGNLDGATPEANDLARAQAWARLLALLSGMRS